MLLSLVTSPTHFKSLAPRYSIMILDFQPLNDVRIKLKLLSVKAPDLESKAHRHQLALISLTFISLLSFGHLEIYLSSFQYQLCIQKILKIHLKCTCV